MTPRLRAPLAPCALLACTAVIVVGGSHPALAQGVPDPRTGITLPNAQSAAVEDATALLVNPAGIALVEGLELSLGGFLRADTRTSQTDFDATLVTTPMGGVGFGLGAGLTSPTGARPLLRTSVGLAAATDSTLSLGVAVHGLTPLGGTGDTDWALDIGTQIRPSRWLAVGVVAESLGDEVHGGSARVGVSLRPLREMLTIGVDARITPGSRDPASPNYAAAASVVPGAVARLDLGGLALTAGASMKNIGGVQPGPPELEVMGGLELNGGNLGLTLLGGADGILGSAQRGAGGARLRVSSAKWTPLLPERGRWLSLSLVGDGVVDEDRDGGLLSELFAEDPQAITVLAALHNAVDDASVDGIVLQLEGLQLGWGRMAELRTAITELREAGKKVVVYMAGADDGDMFLASAADRIFLAPAGFVELNGLRAEMTYFGDTLDKIGVQAEAVSAGKYKSAPRTFTANEPSPEELEVEAALLDGVWSVLTQSVAEGRGLTVDQVKTIIDRGGLTGPQALEAKLIDGLAYPDELVARVEELAGRDVFLEERFLSREDRVVRWDTRPKIALIPVEGTIAMSGGFSLFGGGGASAEDLVEAIDSAAGDSEVRAIVLRIDSPGGDALASDLIWRAVMNAREKKPVIASMGDVAASGGYYVAAAANTIFAEKNTITGSIGVFGLLFNVERLADEWGVRTYPVERGALPGPSVFRPLGEGERAALQGSVDATYERFLDAVIAGRGEQSGLDKEELRPLAEGRVWTGAQAHERKLVDQMGGLLAALEEARARAGLDEDEDIALDVKTGRDDGIGRLTGLARALGGSRDGALVQAVKFLLGDPQALSFALEHEGRPLAVTPRHVHVE